MAQLVEDTKTDLSGVVDTRAIRELPINGRRVDSFVLLTPAVSDDGNYGLLTFRGVAGQNSFLVDGADAPEGFYKENTRAHPQCHPDLAGCRAGIPGSLLEQLAGIRPGDGRPRKHSYGESTNNLFLNNANSFLANGNYKLEKAAAFWTSGTVSRSTGFGLRRSTTRATSSRNTSSTTGRSPAIPRCRAATRTAARA